MELTEREAALVIILLNAVSCEDTACDRHKTGCNGTGLFNTNSDSDCGKLWNKLSKQKGESEK